MRKRERQSRRAPSLAAAIALAGNPSALATLLGVTPSTVRRWVARGITPGGTKLLEGLRERLRAQEDEEKNKRQTFDLLLKLAGERSIDHQKEARREGKDYKWKAGDKPTKRGREGVRAGPRTSGFQWVLRVEKMLTEGLIVEIAMWLSSKRRRFPLWQASMVVSEYSKRKFMNTGSNSLEAKNLLFQVAAVPESGDFLTNEIVATRRSESLADARDDLVAKMEEALEEGSLVYIHEVTLFNYRMRTEKERLAWESGKRMGRKRRAKRRKKQSAVSDRRSAGAGKKEKAWPKTPTSKKSSKRSKPSASTATKSKQSKKTRAKATSKKPAVSRSKSVSTRSRRTGLSLRQASEKLSVRKTSVSRSQVTTSKKFTKKPKSSSARSKSRATSKTQAVTRGGTKTKTKKTKTKKTKTTRRS